jgi:phosphatidate cytidylyltransferase
MLKQRVITAVILAALVFGAILFFPPAWFQVFIAACIALGCWEWSALAGVRNTAGRGMFTALCVALMFVTLHLTSEVRAGLLYASAAWWLVAFVLVFRYPNGAAAWHRTAALLPLGLVVLLPGWLALVALRGLDRYLFFILLLIGLIVAADSGAYFAGRAFGKHKLAVRVSPNKTWEGFAGGQLAACALLWITLVASGVELNSVQWVMATLGTLVLASASVVGDLFESMLKRQAGVKDSGTLLPGHGGVLDRIDSLSAALPVYSALLLLAGVL